MLTFRRVLLAVISLHALLALQSPSPPQPPATATPSSESQTVLWFRSADAAAIDGRALLDAVAVYTRDLGLTVRTAAGTRAVPADAAAAADAAATLRAQHARLGFWCEMRPGADVAALAVVATDGHLELHLVERAGAHEAEQYRAIALKLRSVLVGTATPEPTVVVPAAPPPAPPPPRAPPPPPAASPDLSIRARPSPVPPPRAWRPFVSVGYRLTTPLASASAHHGLALGATIPAGTWLEIDLGTELSPRREQTATTTTGGVSTTDTVSVFDWPIRAGARIVRRVSATRVTLGAGPFAAIHLLWASADASDQMHASSFTPAGGAGAELLGRFRLTGALAAELRLYGEVPLPTTSYSFRGTGAEVLDLGARAGVGLGLAFPAP